MTGSQPRSARHVVEELFRRQQAADDTVLDDLVATDMVNHAAGPQGRDGLKAILRTIEVDLGWTFIHIWRVADGMLVEHWACRDDMGLLEQLRRP